jgi:alcohol dehydrogenase class IV
MDFNIKTKVLFGFGIFFEKKNFSILKRKKVLILTNKLIFDLFLKKFTVLLNEINCSFVIIKLKDQEPLASSIDKKFKTINKKYDYIMAVGGGSVIDYAKAISIKISYPKDKIWNFASHNSSKQIKIKKKLTPVISVPTTAGTGSEVTPFSVVSNSKVAKGTIKSVKIVPKLSIIDPYFLIKLPKKIKFFTGIDALAHSIESFLSNKLKPKYIYKTSATSIFLIIKSFKKYFDGSIKECENLALASLLAGYSISNGGTAAPHAFAQSLGVIKNINHAESVAIFLKKVLDITNTRELNRINFEIKKLFPDQKKVNIKNEIAKIYKLIKIKKLKLLKKEKLMIYEDIKKNRLGSIKKYPINLNDQRIKSIIESVCK